MPAKAIETCGKIAVCPPKSIVASWADDVSQPLLYLVVTMWLGSDQCSVGGWEPHDFQAQAPFPANSCDILHTLSDDLPQMMWSKRTLRPQLFWSHRWNDHNGHCVGEKFLLCEATEILGSAIIAGITYSNTEMVFATKIKDSVINSQPEYIKLHYSHQLTWIWIEISKSIPSIAVAHNNKRTSWRFSQLIIVLFVIPNNWFV